MTSQSDTSAVAARRRPKLRRLAWTLALTAATGALAFAAVVEPRLLSSPETSGRLAGFCSPLTVTDAATGEPLRGIEDLVALPDGSLLLSAQDRWNFASSGDASPSGLYRLPPDWTNLAGIDGSRPVAARNLTQEIFPVFRPHGIDAIAGEDGSVRVFAVNQAGGSLQSSIAIDVFDLRDEHLSHVVRIDDSRFCQANDLAAIDGQTALVTLDTAACGRVANWRELVFGPPAGSVVRLSLPDPEVGEGSDELQVTPLVTGLRFANGIAIGDEAVWVAETRGQRLLRLPIEIASAEAAETGGDNMSSAVRVPLPASPDNLTLTADGDLLVTQHPSLLRLAVHRAPWLRLGSSGTRVDRLATGDAEDAEAQLEWLDPQGRLLSAGTVAAQSPAGLVVGSVTATGLAWCQDPGQD